MPDIAIRIESVFKCYQVYGKPHDRLKQAVLPHAHRALGRPQRKYFDEFWALRGVSFEVVRGQTVGIIGRNGSGKSTLLQIVCGTLAPTAGNVDIDGRVAALLELGSGFNPEFTGRENVYLNGSVLGLTREQIDQRFEDIELFADIGDFMDQPVKTYSSGMVVRLAFAVIAHVDAEILVIDEALAVGDAAFTQKCMRFLRAFKKKGTILFVSHDAASVLNLCDRAIWMHQGQIRMKGSAEEVSNAYLEFTAQEVYGDSLKLHAIRESRGEVDLEPAPVPPSAGEDETHLEFFDNIANSDGWESGAARIERVEMHDASGNPCGVLRGGEKVHLRIRARCEAALASPIIGFFVKDKLGQSLFGDNTYGHGAPVAAEAGSTLEASFTFHLPMLPNGTYSMTVAIADGDPFNHVQHHWLHDALLINVASGKLRYGLVGIPFDRVSLDIVRVEVSQ
ncbi:ABC transporter ATP-binding protein [Luteimonas vadosa]|uniref:ABC transporter ATP-binding protein n=1 Tax=Luteimonas vadosa TaxID=1165507 RepID=A0ABP9DPD2_9GAMM